MLELADNCNCGGAPSGCVYGNYNGRSYAFDSFKDFRKYYDLVNTPGGVMAVRRDLAKGMSQGVHPPTMPTAPTSPTMGTVPGTFNWMDILGSMTQPQGGTGPYMPTGSPTGYPSGLFPTSGDNGDDAAWYEQWEWMLPIGLLTGLGIGLLIFNR